MKKLIDPETVELCRKGMLNERDYDDMSLIFDMFGDSTRLKIMSGMKTPIATHGLQLHRDTDVLHQ